MRRLAIGLVVIGSGVAIAGPASKPKLSFGPPIVSDGYDAKTVQTTFKKSMTPLLACYQKALAKDGNLTGSVTVTFLIGADGKVIDADATGIAETCVANTVSRMKFAKPKEGATVAVSYPLTFDLPAAQQNGQMPQQDDSFASVTGIDDISSGFDTSAGEVTAGLDQGHGDRRANGVAIIALGQLNSAGDLDGAIVRRYIKRNIQKLKFCYEKQLLAKPRLGGTVQTHFTISTEGIVMSSKASGVDPEVATCMAGVINAIEFPRPKHGEVDVNYPFTLRSGTPASKP